LLPFPDPVKPVSELSVIIPLVTLRLTSTDSLSESATEILLPLLALKMRGVFSVVVSWPISVAMSTLQLAIFPGLVALEALLFNGFASTAYNFQVPLGVFLLKTERVEP
jgi:hypothetical protein